MHSGARPFEDQNEIARFLAAIDGAFKLRDRALVTLGLYAGLRVASALSLKVGDVFDGRHFRRSVRVARKSMKGRRGSFVIPLHPKAARAIARWLVELRRRGIALDPELPIFLSRQQGRAMTTRAAGMMISKAARRAGLDEGISSHSWRKTFCRPDLRSQWALPADGGGRLGTRFSGRPNNCPLPAIQAERTSQSGSAQFVNFRPSNDGPGVRRERQFDPGWKVDRGRSRKHRRRRGERRPAVAGGGLCRTALSIFADV